MVRKTQMMLVGVVICAFAIVSTPCKAGTIIKLSLGGDAAADIEFTGGALGDLSTADDSILSTGDQNTAVDFVGFLEPYTTDILTSTASFTLKDLKVTGAATIINGVLVFQNFAGGTLELYDPANVLLLSGSLATSSLSGTLGPPGTGGLFTTSFALVTGGTLAPYIDPTSLTLSVSLVDINGGAGLIVVPPPTLPAPVVAFGVLEAFTADASLLIAGEFSGIPEPATIALLLVGAPCAFLPCKADIAGICRLLLLRHLPVGAGRDRNDGCDLSNCPAANSRISMYRLLAIAAATQLLLCWTGSSAAEPRRPNILFVIVDDQSPFDLRVYEPKSALQTPVIDRLAAQGMVFDSAYHMGSFIGAVCTPSRHMLLCGRTVWHLPISPDAKSYCPPDLEQQTMAAVFNRAGYATMRTCKIGNSYEGADKQFTVRRDGDRRGGDDLEGSAWHAEQVLDYLEERESSGDTRPFLIFFGFSHPHDPRNGKPGLLAKYGAVNHADRNSLPPANSLQPALPVNYLPAHPFDHGQPGLRDEVDVSGVWENRDERTIRNELGRHFACSENIDTQIGRVLEKLDSIDELSNTYVFYTSDHGIAIGRHGLQGKQNLYEHTWRVPLIVKGPGIKPGERVKGNVYLLDVLATLCDLTGATPPASNEGISFKPVLEGTRQMVRDLLYGVYSGGTKPGMRCLKHGDWKLIKYDVMDGHVRETQLFNLQENPYELIEQHHDRHVIGLTGNTPASRQRNLADDPRYAGKLKELESLLLAEMRRLNDPHRLWNQTHDNPHAR